MNRCRQIACGAALGVVSACAPAPPALPTGAGSEFPGFHAAYEQAVADCRGIRTIVAELGLSGRAGNTKLRGRINAGLAAPSSIRLEGVALGRAIFILAGRDGEATLLLPRDDRVVRNAPPERIVEALAGVAVTPADLLSAVAGCGLLAGEPARGRMFNNEWAAVDVEKTVIYLKRGNGRWRVAAAVRDPLTIRYEQFEQGPPATILLRSQSSGSQPAAEITLRVSQLETNTQIDAKAFEVEIPRDAETLSLEELRRAGPLGERRE